MIIKMLVLSKYTRKGASSRLRLFQFIPTLESAGLKVEVAPFFDDAYLDNIYCKRQIALFRLLIFYFKRMYIIINAKKATPLLVQGELFPWLPHWVEKFFLVGRSYALDYDDAIFHRYDMHRSRLVRALLGRKIDKLMAEADLVIAGNRYLEKRDAVMGESLLTPAFRCGVRNEMAIVLSRPTVPVGGNDLMRRVRPWIILSVSTCRSKAAPFAF